MTYINQEKYLCSETVEAFRRRTERILSIAYYGEHLKDYKQEVT